MSGLFALVVAAGAHALSPGAAPRAAVTAPEILEHALSIDVPSVDGLRGATVSFEHFLPARRVSVGVSAPLRQSATGDYTGVRTGGGIELRWYWRANHKAALARQPAGSMVGWFAGARVDLALDATHDDVDGRWLPSTIETDAKLELGYRFVPWRALAITPWLTAGLRHELVPRTPDWTRPTVGLGLSVGWLF